MPSTCIFGCWHSLCPVQGRLVVCGIWCSPPGLMGVRINMAQLPYPWLALKAMFYPIPQSFSMELSPGHPLWWLAFMAAFPFFCHLPTTCQCPVPSQATHTHSVLFLEQDLGSFYFAALPLPTPSRSSCLGCRHSMPWLPERKGDRPCREVISSE